MLGVLIVASSLPIMVPTQKILVVFGDVGTQILFAAALFVMTVAMMPCIRFLLKSMSCVHGHPPFLPGAKCFQGIHLYYVAISPALLAVTILLSIQWEILTTSPIEMAKQDRVFCMSMRETKYPFQILVIKILFVLPLSILAPVLSVELKAFVLLVLAVAALACFLHHRPLYYVNMTSGLAIPLIYAMCNNLVAILVIRLPDGVASPLVVAYVACSVPSALVAYTVIHDFLVRDTIRKMLVQATFRQRPRKAKRKGLERRRSSSASPKVLPEATSSTYTSSSEEERRDSVTAKDGELSDDDDDDDDGLRQLNLDKYFLGASGDAISRYADVLRRLRLSELSLRFNEFSSLHLAVLLAAVQGSSRGTLRDLDLGCNRTQFLRGVNECGALGDVALSSTGRSKFLHKLGYQGSTLGDEAKDAWRAHTNLLRSGKKKHELASAFNSLRPVDPCCVSLRTLSLKKTFLPLVVLDRLVGSILASPSIEELDLTECHMDHVHAKLVGKLLEGNRLTTLLLRYNRLGERGSLCLARSASAATKLKMLDVGACTFFSSTKKNAPFYFSRLERHRRQWRPCHRRRDYLEDEAQRRMRASFARFVIIPVVAGNTIPRLEFVKIKSDIKRRFEEEEKSSVEEGPPVEEALCGRSLCLALGGEKAIAKIVDRFYIYVVTDPVLSHYFRNISMGRMRHLQSSFISEMLGSSKPYRGRDLASGHARLGITHDQFDQTCAWFIRSIEDVCEDLAPSVLEACVGLLFGLRPQIVTKDPHKEPSLIDTQR
ncbi:hypothetical protein CTAYLR_005982 [Chrysophaeum taylorii]|uniref:Globin family profile domain-containing protein n=1 Tax=Chrysophaeum taylorii TaxID=2483200 RepID=A0AAD7XPJ0_9STRA|nr:hypothetical protein CTAYLR_005982 [Chrysophaeum taylorii]